MNIINIVTIIFFSSFPSFVREECSHGILTSREGDYLTKKHSDTILEQLEKFDSMVIGPGISENLETIEFVLGYRLHLMIQSICYGIGIFRSVFLRYEFQNI